MISPMLRAVIGIWSEWFINHSNNVLKFRINNKIVKVWVEKKIYVFFIEDYDFYIRAYSPDVVSHCQNIKRMLED